MKILFRLSILFSYLFYLFHFDTIFAQNNIKQQITASNGTPKMIEFYPPSQTQGIGFAPPSATSVAISSTIAGNILNTYLTIPVGNTFSQISKTTDNYSITHTKYQQYYNGIKVEGAVYMVHDKDNYVSLMNGEFKPVAPNTSTQATLSETNALINAKNSLRGVSNFATVPPAELVFIDPQMSGSSVRLAYKFSLFSSTPTIQGYYVYVDAQNGNILFKNSYIHNCFAHNSTVENPKAKTQTEKLTKNLTPALGSLSTKYSGVISVNTDFFNGSYRLRDYSRGSGIETYNAYNLATYTPGPPASVNYDGSFPVSTDYTDTDNNWQEYNNTQKDNAALDVHTNTQNTYDYFKNTYNRNSLNNSGLVLKSYVNLFGNILNSVPSNQRGFASNAYWDGTRMVYFCGDGINYGPLVSQDVVAHELGHGLCQFTAGLYYFQESGALNEALSDIWGATVEYYKFGSTKQTWLIGEEFDLVNQTGFRSMSNPKSKGQPNTYRGQNWVWNNFFDGAGVHFNSGVINYWYYLLCQGGSGINDFNINYNVSPIGISSAAAITYYAETNLLTPTSNFLDFRNYLIQAATTLYGASSSQVTAVIEAFKAVGLTNPLQFGQEYYPTPCLLSDTPTSSALNGSDGVFESGVWAVTGCFTNHAPTYIQCLGGSGTYSYSSVIAIALSDKQTVIEAGKKISFIPEANRINNTSVPLPASTYIRLDPGPTGRIALRICTNYNTSGARQSSNETVANSIIDKEKVVKLNIIVSPNPTVDNFNVYYQLAEPSSVKIVLYNSEGKEIAILADERNQEGGEYIVGYDTENLSSGIYIIKLTTPLKSVSSKLVLQK